MKLQLPDSPEINVSPREYEAVKLYAKMSTTDVGKTMKISVKTASTYLSRIQEKLGLQPGQRRRLQFLAALWVIQLEKTDEDSST